MCMCDKPTINGEPGYTWNGEQRHVRPIDAPALAENDELLYDCPGRCGHGIDSHCQHFRIVKERWGGYTLLVRNGCGDQRIKLGSRPGAKVFANMSADDLYWMLQMIYRVQGAAADEARHNEATKWISAASEKRIKMRKRRGHIQVSIEPRHQGYGLLAPENK